MQLPHPGAFCKNRQNEFLSLAGLFGRSAPQQRRATAATELSIATLEF
jgi:hypothetical protein